MAHISEITNEKVTVLLDGNSIAYRAFFKAPPLNAGNMPTGVIHVFLSVLEKLFKTPEVAKIIAVFDAKGKNARHEMLEAYKATRQAMPEDLSLQIEALKEIIPYMGVPLYSISGYEADDVLFTLAEKLEGPVWLVTKDKDLHQLVNERVKIYDYQTGNLIDRQVVFEKFGLYPENILDMLSLAGDTSDNIPGVSGIGVKTAQSLIEKYGSLDKIYENIVEIKGKLQEKLINGKDNAYLSRELATLMKVTDLPYEEVQRDNDKLKAFYEKYRLKYHLKHLEIEMNGSSKDNLSKEEDSSISNFLDEYEFPVLEEGKVEKPKLIAYIEGEVYFAGDGRYSTDYSGCKAQYYFDIKNLYKKDVVKEESILDIMLAAWLNDPDSGGLKKSKTESSVEFLSRIYALSEKIEEKLKELELEKLYYDIELPVAFILGKAENTGIFLDVGKIREIAASIKTDINKFIIKINNKAGFDLNPNSPKQLGEYLYDVLSIKPLKKNKTGYSTNEETLLDLRVMYPDHAEIIDDILKYRELNKILSTYTENLLDFRGEDGRIRTDFKQTGTATGRLSSANPNLQNIPQKSDLSEAIRGSFVAGDGKSFVSLDYSQIELRILAHLSGDKNLIAAFMHNEDIHSMTARTIFHLPENEEVSHNLRRIAKAINFGILYGLSPFGLSRDAKVPAAEAKVFIDRYFALYNNIKTFIAETIEETKLKGYCSTVLGRKRFIKDINSRNGNIRQRAERMAINAPIQGSAADIIKLAMIECDKYIKNSGINAKLILQIHDELLFEVPDGEVENFSRGAKEVMESVFKMKVPLLVNCSTGKNWGDL